MHPIFDYAPSLVLVAVALAIPSENEFSPSTIEVSNLSELALAQEHIEAGGASSSKPLLVKIAKGVYELDSSFRIDRSNVSLIGEPGAKFVLAAGVNQPVVAIGTQKEWVDTSDVIESIRIYGIEIDGNKDNQDSELSADKPWIRNNGIDVRGVRNLIVDGVKIRNNRSGGLVISWKSSDVEVRNSVFEKNFFDGVAYYDSIRVSTTDCEMRHNNFAGISLDNRLVDSSFNRCKIESNGNVGVFARNSIGLRFENCQVRDSADWAVFLAHDLDNLGVHDSEFKDCLFERNLGGIFMASVNETQSSGTRVVNSSFIENEVPGRLNVQSSGSRIVELANVTSSPETLVSSSE